DDSHTIRSEIKKMVEVLDVEVLEAENGIAAHEILQGQSSEINLILLDWEMPEMNGYDFLVKAKENKTSSPIPVVMLTSISQKEKMIDAIRDGAKQYITKSFTSEGFLTKILQTLGPENLEQI
ncbi:MAG: response regulator, partial [bacterium]|nr:response regulator [bacterium]